MQFVTTESLKRKKANMKELNKRMVEEGRCKDSVVKKSHVKDTFQQIYRR
jgi:hypothetical protein